MQRRFHLNLAALDRYGTVEFRAHSATYDEERFAHWLQFTIAFVETFGKSGGTYTGMKSFFQSQSADTDYRKLQRAQQTATRTELFRLLGSKVDASTENYYKLRKWEQIRDQQGKLVEDETCHPSGQPGIIHSSC